MCEYVVCAGGQLREGVPQSKLHSLGGQYFDIFKCS